MNKKILLTIGICLITIIIFMVYIFVFKKEIYFSFKESEKLNYSKDIKYLSIVCSKDMQLMEGEKKIIIDDKEDIEEIINYLNSLDLVEVSGFRGYDYDKKHFSIEAILKKDVNEYEGFSFMSGCYLIQYDGDNRFQPKEFYIKDSEVDESGKNKVYYFLYDLINK